MVNLGSSLELETPMLLAKFKDHRTFGSGEEDFQRLWHGGNLGHVTLTIYINFLSHFPKLLHTKFDFVGQAVSV